jgi:hypothetical protein
MADKTELLTEAQARSGVIVNCIWRDSTASNVRVVPYAERYAGSTALFQTPVQRLQQAAQTSALLDR